MNRTTTAHPVRRALLFLAVATAIASTGALAQTNASGTIFGSGATPGSVIVIENAQTGFRREIAVDGNGRYRATALPVGNYDVTLQREGNAVARREGVTVLLGAGSEVSFAAADSNAQTLDNIVVSSASANVIDVSSVDTRTVLTDVEIENITVARNINALAVLSPGVVQADSRYGSTASFGGSSASENAIYINGYAVTNPLTNLGSTTLPFDAIAQYQAITGGYGAEFGRATGGVVNILTKRGTNEWKAGATVVWTPESQTAKRKDLVYPANGYATDGLVYQNLRDRKDDSLTYGAYVSGPIVKDKLFFYASGEFTDRDLDWYNIRTGSATTGYRETRYDIPRWLAKVDWNITDNHNLELTAISDVTKEKVDYFAYNYATGVRGDQKTGGFDYEDGGELYIGKYTGYLTDNLTLTALYGKQDQDHTETPFGFNSDPNAVYVGDNRPIVERVTGQQPIATLSDPDAYDSTEGGRLDLEWSIGAHTLRFGVDQQDLESRRGVSTTGPGYYWTYETVGAANANQQIPGSGGAAGPGGNGDYVVKRVRLGGGTFKVEQSAQYIEDRWQLNDRWLLSFGLRNEQFSNFNTEGEAYVEQRHQLAPRLGVAWDVNGDASLKVFANAGRYHLALPNNVAYRGASPSTITSEYFAFTGIDPATGVPTGLTALGNGPYSANSEYGQAQDPRTIAAKNLKSHFQDEVVFGYEKQLPRDLVFGNRFVYRDLKSAIDDFCDPRPGIAWAEANGVDPYLPGGIYDSFHSCRLFNPGENNTYTIIDDAGTVLTVPLSAEAIGIPKLKRRYLGVDFFIERPFDGKWYAKIDYTWSKNYGNAEGQLLSDFGQADVSQTLNFDHRELALHSNGYLPNDRRHYVKAFGFYQFTPSLQASGTFTWASGRPRNRYGYYPDGDDFFYDDIEYGAYYHYADGAPSPRGTSGRLPSTARFDAGFAWRPGFLDNKLQLRLDVFNLFDAQVKQNVNETYESGGVGTRYSQYGRVVSYTAPRSTRFTLRYDW